MERKHDLECTGYGVGNARTEIEFEPVWVGRGQIMKDYLVLLAFHKGKGKPSKNSEPVRCIILM